MARPNPIRDLRNQLDSENKEIGALIKRKAEIEGEIRTVQRQTRIRQAGLVARQAGVKAPPEFLADGVDGELTVESVREFAERYQLGVPPKPESEARPTSVGSPPVIGGGGPVRPRQRKTLRGGRFTGGDDR